MPLLNQFDLAAAFVLHACWKWTAGEPVTPSAASLQESVRLGCYLGAFLWLTTLAALTAVGMKLSVEPDQHVSA